MATHSSVLAWRISGTGEPGGCRLWGHTESDTTEVTWGHTESNTTEVTQHSIAQHSSTPGKFKIIFNDTVDPVYLNINKACMLSDYSHVQLFATLWTVAHQALLSMGFSRQEYWSGQPFPPPGDLPNSGIEPTSLTSPALAGRFFTASATWEVVIRTFLNKIVKQGYYSVSSKLSNQLYSR